MNVKPVSVLQSLVCIADALVQTCQDMYSTYVNVISAQTSILLSRNVLQPQQLTESCLAGISGNYTEPFIRQAEHVDSTPTLFCKDLSVRDATIPQHTLIKNARPCRLPYRCSLSLKGMLLCNSVW